MTLARARNGVAALVIAAAALPGQSARKTRPLSFTRFTLPNGLVTIVNEDHSSPIVGLDVMYHVGSKDELPGHQQVAHTCEHLMFEGSPHQPNDGKKFYGSLGGSANGLTGDDKTDFIATIPSNALEPALWYEADRMAAPAFHSDSQSFEVVRATIAQERRGHLAPIFAAGDDGLLRMLYGKDHPYSWYSGDVMPGVDKTPAAEVHAFCAAHYLPNNAVLAISGDVNPTQVRTWVQKYFGAIPRGAVTKATFPRPTLAEEKRVVLEDARARAPALRVAWIGAGYSSPDKMALQALGFVLTGDRRSGLVKALTRDRRLATSVLMANYDEELSGEFVLAIDALPNASLTAIEQVVDSAVAAARDQTPPASALADFRGFARLRATSWIEPRTNRADTLAQGQGYMGDPVRYAKELDLTESITPADVQRVARKYLTPGRVVLSFVPAGKLDMVSKPNLPYVKLDGNGFPMSGPPSEHHENPDR